MELDGRVRVRLVLDRDEILVLGERRNQRLHDERRNARLEQLGRVPEVQVIRHHDDRAAERIERELAGERFVTVDLLVAEQQLRADETVDSNRGVRDVSRVVRPSDDHDFLDRHRLRCLSERGHHRACAAAMPAGHVHAGTDDQNLHSPPFSSTKRANARSFGVSMSSTSFGSMTQPCRCSPVIDCLSRIVERRVTSITQL